MKCIDGYWVPDCDDPLRHSLLIEAMNLCRGYRLAVDVGANVGLVARLLEKRFTHVIAYEPYPEAYHCCVRNLKADSDVRNLAVMDKVTMASMVLSEGKTASQKTRIMERGAPHGSPIIRATTLDVDLHEIGEVDFIKIDTEGCEPLVLRGATRTIQTYRPVILIEERNKRLADEKEERRFTAEVRQLLSLLNYTQVLRRPPDAVFIPCERAGGWDWSKGRNVT